MKALVLTSGGLDSATCLGMAVKKYGHENVIALSIFYGQKHDKELQASKDLANYYKVNHITLDLKKIFEASNCSLLQWSTQEVPHNTYNEQLEKTNGEPVSTYVPFRNGLFLSSAASVAISNDCEVIYYGAHSDDAAGNAYPDTSVEFNTAMQDAVYLGSGKKLKIESPFVSLTKADVVKIGTEINVPYHLTWSCYEGKKCACGTCGTCLDRIKAFILNKLMDPVEYQIPVEWEVK